MNASANTTIDCLTGNYSCPANFDYPIPFVVWSIVDKVLVVLTNGTTLMILLKYDMLETATNIFICCLTLADLIYAVSLPFALGSLYLPFGIAWNISCFINIYIQVIAGTINAIILCAIAVERLLYLVYSLDYHRLLPVKRAIHISCALWVLVMLCSLAFISAGYKDASMDGALARQCLLGISVTYGPAWIIVVLLSVPITIGCYIKISLVALEQKKRIAAMNIQPLQIPNPGPSSSKITKVMLRVLLVYILCTLSLIAVPIVYFFFPEHMQLIGINVALLVWRINTWLNPFIYAWKSETFRKHLKTFFRIGLHHDSNRFNIATVP